MYLLFMSLAFLAGSTATVLLPRLPFALPLIIIVVLALSFFSLTNRWLRFIVMLSLGFYWTVQAAQHFMESRLPLAWINKTLVIQGYIASLPQQENKFSNFIFHMTAVVEGRQLKPQDRQIKLNWFNTEVPLQVGDQWQFVVKLKPNHSFANPGSFDYERWLMSHDIQAGGNVQKGWQTHLMNSHWYRYPCERFRQYLLNKIKSVTQNFTYRGFMMALTLGEERDITPAQWQLMRATGISHLMAVSGSNISLISGMLFFCGRFLWSRSEKFCLWLPAPQMGAIVAIIIAVLYSFISGFSVPTERAMIVILIFMLQKLRRRAVSAVHFFALSLFSVLFLQPLAILQESFWLSFAAVAVILYFTAQQSAHANKYWQAAKLQLSINLTLIPISLLFFQQVSVVAPLANAIAIPWVGVVMTPLCLVACLTLFISTRLATLLFYSAEQGLHGLCILLNQLQKLPHAVWYYAFYSVTGFLIFSAGILIVLIAKPWFMKVGGSMLLLGVLLWPTAKPHYGDIWATLLDVGQGLAVIIQTQQHLLIYDTGPQYGPSFDAGQAILLPYLNYNGFTKIDTLIVSHADNDHSGGVKSLLTGMPTKLFLSSVPQKFSVYQAQSCHRGQTWQWDGVTFSLLAPVVQVTAAGNNSSCVLKISNGAHSLLLPGDIERPTEDYLVENNSSLFLLQSEILIAPHHGSATSSSLEFINAVQPRWVFYSAGLFNRYHLPNATIIERYRQRAIQAATTAYEGAITLHLPPQAVSITPLFFRKIHRHFWNN